MSSFKCRSLYLVGLTDFERRTFREGLHETRDLALYRFHLAPQLGRLFASGAGISAHAVVLGLHLVMGCWGEG